MHSQSKYIKLLKSSSMETSKDQLKSHAGDGSVSSSAKPTYHVLSETFNHTP